MQAFGNIVSKSKVDANPSLFNITDSLDRCIPDIPTLIIGLDNAKSMIPGFSILEKDYRDKHWTYSKTERRCDYEDDLEKFCSDAISGMLKSSAVYKYVDFTSLGLRTTCSAGAGIRSPTRLESPRMRLKTSACSQYRGTRGL